MINELIKRMKHLNRCSYLKLKAHKKEDRLYGFLSQIMPVPKQKKIVKRIILYQPIKRYYFIPDNFNNDFWKGRVVLHGKCLKQDTMKASYSENPTIEDLKIMYELTQQQMNEVIKARRETYISRFNNDIRDFEVVDSVKEVSK